MNSAAIKFYDDMGEDHDDTAANGFKFRCVGLQDDTSVREYSPGDGPYGEWAAYTPRYSNYMVCALRVRYSDDPLDYTGVNGMEIKVCEVHTPIYLIEGRWKEVQRGSRISTELDIGAYWTFGDEMVDEAR